MFDWLKKSSAKHIKCETPILEQTISAPRKSTMNTDRPIPKFEDDKLNRGNFANVISKQIADSPSDDSYVIGLTGPWGFGKTSILNMIEERLTKESIAHVIWFNPWMFSGTEQLLTQFFRELSAQLSGKGIEILKTLGDQIQKYGSLLSPISSIPFIKGWVGDIKEYTDAAGDILKGMPGKNSSVFDQRKEIEKILKKVDRPIAIFIDDIDRLRQDEIRDIMKLVRLTADFSNVVYLLSFDRERVERALDEGSGDGGAYLEKILQITFDVPQLRESQISELLIGELDLAIKDKNTGPFISVDWQNYFHSGILPMVKNLRDIRRYVNALPAAIALMGEDIALSDVLALEAIRVFCPRSFAILPEIIDPLTRTTSKFGRNTKTDDEGQKKLLDNFFSNAGENRQSAIRHLSSHLFPVSQKYTRNTSYGDDWLKTWRMSGRVSHVENLLFYLEKSLPSNEFSNSLVRKFFENLVSPIEIQSSIGAMSTEQFSNMLVRIQDFEDKFTDEMAENAIPILLNNIHKVREEKQHMFDFGGDLQLKRVVYRLIRQVKSEEDRLKIVTNTLPKIETISCRLILITIVSHKENVGHRLIEKDEAERLEVETLKQVSLATKESLINEVNLPGLLQLIRDECENGHEKVAEILSDDLLLLQILRRSLGESFSATLGESVEKKTHTLPWQAIQNLVGDVLNKRVAEIFKNRDTLNLESRSLLALDIAHKYVTGELKQGRIDEEE